jgi:hypothetical protein
MKKESILNLKENATRKEIEEALLNVCTKNKRLTSFIKKVFKKNKDIEICAFDDEDEKFDIECGDGGHYEPTELLILHSDFIDEESEDDGWFPEDVHPMFDKYFLNFDWDSITLDNGKILILTDNCHYLSFQIFDLKNLEDGKIDNLFVENVTLDSVKRILNN